MSEKVFEGLPCIVELFGHQQIAGKLTEVSIGGSALIRVDVPQVDGQAAFTKFYGTGAIYAITPTNEETMLAAVRGFKVEPIQRWQLLPEKTLSPAQIAKFDPEADFEDSWYEDEEEDDDDFDDFDDDEEEDFGTIADREYDMHEDDAARETPTEDKPKEERF